MKLTEPADNTIQDARLRARVRHSTGTFPRTKTRFTHPQTGEFVKFESPSRRPI